MWKKTNELEVDGKVVLKIKPRQESVKLQYPSSYGGWTDVMLDRGDVLELRDICEAILSDWFCAEPIVFSPADVGRLSADRCAKCNDQPVIPGLSMCQTCFVDVGIEYAKAVREKYADVGRLDMGEPLEGRETGQVMQGGCEVSSPKADEDYLDGLRRTT